MREDCFAYEESKGKEFCKALKENICMRGSSCKFYKTTEQLGLEEIKVNKRLNSLNKK